MHPLLIPPFTNKTLRRAVKDYLAGGDKKKRIVEKYGEISNWDTCSRSAYGAPSVSRPFSCNLKCKSGDLELKLKFH